MKLAISKSTIVGQGFSLAFLQSKPEGLPYKTISRITIGCWLLAFSATTYANWTKTVVDAGPYGYLTLGKGRNDDTVRLYGIANNLLQEVTYRNGSWHRDTVGLVGSNLVIAPARNDGINRIYSIKADSLYEYTWVNGNWLKESYLLPDSASQFFAAPLRNDDTMRIYLFLHEYQIFYLYELTYRYGVWDSIKPDSFPKTMWGDFAVDFGRNDDTLRLYSPMGLLINEITYSAGQWREETWDFSTGGEESGTSMVIGKNRNDGINRICLGRIDDMAGIFAAEIYEITYSPTGWSITGYPYDWWAYAAGWRPAPYPLLIGLVRKNFVGLYAYIIGYGGVDTTGLFEFTYHSTVWKREMVDKEQVASLTAGQSRNDDTSRLYGIQNSTIIEFSRSTEVINETEIPKPILPTLQIHPNPFSEKTEIRYATATTSNASISIFDASGRLIKVFPKTQSPESKVSWNGDDELGRKVPSGIYFCQLKTGEQTITKKITLLR